MKKKRKGNQINKNTLKTVEKRKKKINDQREIEGNHLAAQFEWLLNNTYICYVGESLMTAKKHHFIVKYIKIPKKLTQACRRA